MKFLKTVGGFCLTSVIVYSIAGCGTTTVYKSAIAKMGPKGHKFTVHIETSEGGISSEKLSLYINNKKVDEQTISWSQQSCNLTSEYRGMTVQAQCLLKESGTMALAHHCNVYADGVKNTEFDF